MAVIIMDGTVVTATAGVVLALPLASYRADRCCIADRQSTIYRRQSIIRLLLITRHHRVITRPLRTTLRPDTIRDERRQRWPHPGGSGQADPDARGAGQSTRGPAIMVSVMETITKDPPDVLLTTTVL
jgi:hypothetical protein